MKNTNSVPSKEDKLVDWLTKPKVKLFGGLLIGIATIAGVGLTWNAQLARPILTFAVQRCAPIFSITPTSAEKLELKLNSIPTKVPFITEIRVENNGSKPIEAKTYTDSFPGLGTGLLVKSGNVNCKILSCSVTEMRPQTRAPIGVKPVVNNSHRTQKEIPIAFIDAVALNPGEDFYIRIISEENPQPVTMCGHLSDGTIQTAVPISEYKPNWDVFFKVFLYTGATLGYLSFALILVCIFAARSLFLYFMKLLMGSVRKVFAWLAKHTFVSNVRAHASSAEKAQKYLLSDADFRVLAENVNADNSEKREHLREVLANIVSESVQPISDEVRDQAVRSNLEEPQNVEEHGNTTVTVFEQAQGCNHTCNHSVNTEPASTQMR